jgi:hypothetical protein
VFGLNLHFVAFGKCAFKSKPSKQQPSKQNIVLVGAFLEWSKVTLSNQKIFKNFQKTSTIFKLINH